MKRVLKTICQEEADTSISARVIEITQREKPPDQLTIRKPGSVLLPRLGVLGGSITKMNEKAPKHRTGKEFLPTPIRLKCDDLSSFQTNEIGRFSSCRKFA
jgi:hypothetical protein